MYHGHVREPRLTAPPSSEALNSSVQGAICWTEGHLAAFDPFIEDRAYSVIYAQRVGELAVALYTHCSLLPEQAGRITHLIEWLDRIRENPEFSHRVLRNPAEFVLNAEVYGILRLLGRDNNEHRTLVQRAINVGLLDHVERHPHRELDVRLALEWSGVEHDWAPMHEIAYKSPLLRGHRSACLLDEEATYALTHLVMFLTDFGVHPEWAQVYPELLSLGHVLDELIAVACVEGHWDLLGELLFCIDAVRLPASEVCNQGWEVFLAAQCDDGSFPGPERALLATRLSEEKLTETERREVAIAYRYHTTLVAWFAVANRLHAKRTPPPAGQRPAVSMHNVEPRELKRDERVAGIGSPAVMAREWLLARAEDQLAANAWEEGQLCSLIVGLYICDALSQEPDNTEAHVHRLGVLLRDGREGLARGGLASVKMRFLVTAILLPLDVEVPAYMEQVARATRLFRREDEAGSVVEHAIEVEEKRAILACYGLCRPSEICAAHYAPAYGEPLLGSRYEDLIHAMTKIEIATRWGTRSLQHPLAPAERSVLLALATAYLRQYDFETGGRLLRAAKAAGALPAQLTEWIDYLVCHQQPSGCFGFFGPEISGFRAKGAVSKNALEQLQLVATVSAIWTLGEVLAPWWTFPPCLGSAESNVSPAERDG